MKHNHIKLVEELTDILHHNSSKFAITGGGYYSAYYRMNAILDDLLLSLKEGV